MTICWFALMSIINCRVYPWGYRQLALSWDALQQSLRVCWRTSELQESEQPPASWNSCSTARKLLFGELPQTISSCCGPQCSGLGWPFPDWRTVEPRKSQSCTWRVVLQSLSQMSDWGSCSAPCPLGLAGLYLIRRSAEEPSWLPRGRQFQGCSRVWPFRLQFLQRVGGRASIRRWFPWSVLLRPRPGTGAGVREGPCFSWSSSSASQSSFHEGNPRVGCFAASTSQSCSRWIGHGRLTPQTRHSSHFCWWAYGR